MPAQPSEQEICKAVLEFAAEGTYPDSEQLVAADVPLPALSKELELITQAKDQVETEISSLSRENDFDVDDWISQAKQLHADLERSRLTAREIVKQHENTGPLQSKVDDSAAKVGLVEKEIIFNQAVTNTLEEVQSLCQRLDATRTLCQDGQITAAIDSLEGIEHAMSQDNCFQNTNVMGILLENVAALRREIVSFLHVRWNRHLEFDQKKGVLSIFVDALGETVSALARLDELTAAKDKFQKDLFLAIFDPVLLSHMDGYSRRVHIRESSIHVNTEPSPASVSDVLGYSAEVFSFLRQFLPASILASLSGSLIPAVSSNIISHWLSSAIPTELDGLGQFETTLNHVLHFSKTMESLGWHGHEELVSWVNQASRLWLTRRRVDSLDQVRKVLAVSRGDSRQVERVEKRQVSESDEVLDNSNSDEWDAGWDDEKEEQPQKNDDEDVSAWGLDDDDDRINATAEANPEADDDGVGDAWGWAEDDEENQSSAENDTQPKEAATTKLGKGNKTTSQTAPKEITLKESYTITDVPDSILRIIQQQIVDSQAISQPSHSSTLVASSGAGLLALPTLILAMFKATASSFYSLKLNAGQMYLYNDSLYLADRVRQVANDNQISRLHADVEALEKFGKLAYSKEMQTQRTIVTDLLDGAQGFSQCSEQPFLGECENSVSATVDRVRDVYKEWQPILSHSALLQAIGSLVSTVVNRFMIDIEDLGDISEPQSQKLVTFCNQLSTLEDLFLPESPDNAEDLVPMTAVYVQNWLKFQYLINILESSLADIKFLWVEGELSLEFSGDEVVDLIEALFAESDYRRKAISEIRRVSKIVLDAANLPRLAQVAAAPAIIFFPFRQAEIFLVLLTNAQTSISLLTHSFRCIYGLAMDNNHIDAADSSQAAQRQVRVQLTSQQEDIALPDNTGPILVPTGLRRYALSTLVNNLLSNDKPIPFEFLINGSFLRTSIDEYLTTNGISAETTLEIEYVRALIPPLHIASFEHDDWVSSVDVFSATSPASTGSTTVSHGQERILSGSYDGLLRVWNMSSQVIATSPSAPDGGHTSSIKSAKFISPKSIVSAGLDRTVRVWKYSESEDGFSGKIVPQLELYGHKSGVNSLDVHAPSNRILSASADHSVGFWSTKKSEAPAAPEILLPSAASRTSKKRKLNTSVSVSNRGPLALLSSHTAPVSATIFDTNDSTVGYSASWDHSLRTWDLVTATLVDTRTTSHSLLSLEHLPDHHLLAAGTSARHITLIDPRASAAAISAMTLRGHTNAVVTLARDPNSTYGLISGSHDGTCRIWDLRATKTDKGGAVGDSVYSISRKSLEDEGKASSKRVGGEGVKVFSVCWDREVGIVSAGEDKLIQINRGEGILSSI
ncbi:hypothetical protein BDW59DRAFT_169113 [Aspergillus cavernicola]|uniref:Ribosome biogenesis protein YTM1 n=1 Tax=Aspergillus cavernicola TaxID=176166 RepID=A0ABR4J0D2_9EURO